MKQKGARSANLIVPEAGAGLVEVMSQKVITTLILGLLVIIILITPFGAEAARPFGGKITSSFQRRRCPVGFNVSDGISIYQSGTIFGGGLSVGKWILGLANSGGPCGLWSIIIAGVSR